MIVDAMFSVLNAILGPIFSVLPTSNLNGLVDAATSWTQAAAGIFGSFNAILPVQEILTAVTLIVGTWVPVMVLYVVAEWIWRHIPSIAGFGTGGG